MPYVLSPLSNVNYVSVLVVADAAPPSLCSGHALHAVSRSCLENSDLALPLAGG